MDLSKFYNTDWVTLLSAPIINPITNQPTLPLQPTDESIIESNKEEKWGSIPLLRRIRNNISLNLSTVELQHSASNTSRHPTHRGYTQHSSPQIKQHVEQIHNLLQNGLELFPTTSSTSSSTYSLFFQQHPFISTTQSILLYILNPLKTSGWRNGHSSYNDSYDLTLITTLLQLLFNLVQFTRYIVSSNHFPALTQTYLQLYGALCNWLLTSSITTHSSSSSLDTIRVMLHHIDRPLLYTLLVFTTQEQHTIVLNILDRILSFGPDEDNQSESSSSGDLPTSPFLYNGALLQRLNTIPPSQSPYSSTLNITSNSPCFAAQWLPLALLFPQQLRQTFNVMGDVALMTTSTIDDDVNNSHTNPTPSIQLPHNLTKALTTTRVDFIQRVLSCYNQIDSSSSFSSEEHSIDCPCHQTTYTYHLDQIDPKNNEDDGDQDYLDRFHHNHENNIIFRDELEQHEGIFGPLVLQGKNLGVLNHRDVLSNLLPPGAEPINNVLFTLPQEHTTTLIKAYCSFDWTHLFSTITSTTTISTTLETIQQTIKNLTNATSSFSAVLCSFGSCCGLDNSNNQILYFIPNDVKVIPKDSIIPVLPIGLTLYDLIASLSTSKSDSTHPTPNTCGHWSTIDSSFFNPQPQQQQQQQTHLRCADCYLSLPYLITQFSTLPQMIVEFSNGEHDETVTPVNNKPITAPITSTTSRHPRRHFWFDTTVFAQTHSEGNSNPLEISSHQTILNLLTQLFLQPNQSTLGDTESSIQPSPLTPLYSCFYLIDLITRIAEMNPTKDSLSKTTTPTTTVNTQLSSTLTIPIVDQHYLSMFLQTKALNLTTLLYKYIYFLSQLLTDSIETHSTFFEATVKPTMTNQVPPQLAQLMSVAIAMWYLLSLLWKSSQLELTSVHRFSPVQSVPTVQSAATTTTTSSQTTTITGGRTAEQATTLPLVPKTSLSCTTVSQTPILFAQPLIYIIQQVFQLTSPLFPDWQEFQSNLDTWNALKKRKAFSMGNVPMPNKTPQLDRKQFWSTIILPSLPSLIQDELVTQQLYIIAPYIKMLDPSLGEVETATYLQTLSQQQQQQQPQLDSIISPLTAIFTGRNPLQSLSQLHHANTITISRQNIHRSIQLCQSKTDFNYAGSSTSHFTQMLGFLVNLLQTSSLLDLSFVAGTDLDPSLEPQQQPQDQDHSTSKPKPPLGDYARLDHEMYTKQMGSKFSPMSPPPPAKKQINVNHSPKLYKTMLLTTLTNLLSTIPSGVTADYQYLSNNNNTITTTTQYDPELYDVANILGALGLLESTLPLLILDTHNPVCREWGILIVKMLTTKITSFLGQDLDDSNASSLSSSIHVNNNDGDDNNNNNNSSSSSLNDNNEVIDETELPKSSLPETTTTTTSTPPDHEDDEGAYTDNQQRLHFQSEMSKRHNESLQAQSKSIYHQQEAAQQQLNDATTSLEPQQPHSFNPEEEYGEQQALRDEILNTPGVKIRTGWESDDDDVDQ